MDSNRRRLLIRLTPYRQAKPNQSPLTEAVQVGLLTPLTFARHRLSPLAAFTAGAYFLRNGRR